MSNRKNELIQYRLTRSRETLEDAVILGGQGRWNSAMNRLYYAAYYAVSALLQHENIQTRTHQGAKRNFSEHFVKNRLVPLKQGRLYSQLYAWRQKGDYDDLFDFDEETVAPYFEPVGNFIATIEKVIRQS